MQQIPATAMWRCAPICALWFCLWKLTSGSCRSNGPADSGRSSDQRDWRGAVGAMTVSGPFNRDGDRAMRRWHSATGASHGAQLWSQQRLPPAIMCRIGHEAQDRLDQFQVWRSAPTVTIGAAEMV